MLKETFRAYVECALWASLDDKGEPLDGFYTADDLATASLDSMRGDVRDFLDLLNREGLADAESPAQIGHDFWLTRNHHGTGFWDRGLGDVGDRLTDFAHAYGESYLFVGDDGLVYVS